MITQKEIAERLGVSRTTVARAINGSSLIKEETKRKILELVKETNYEKNYIGSLLGTKKNKKIYALIVESKNKFYTQAIKKGLNEIKKEYKHYNYNMEIIATNINKPQEQLQKLQEVLEKEEIDGLIITPLDKDNVLKLLEPYIKKIKIVSLGINLENGIVHVGPDHKKQGTIAAGIMSNLLRDKETLLVIDNGDDNVSSKKYLDGFLERIKETQLEILGPYSGEGIENSINLIKELCKQKDIKGIYVNRYAYDIFDKINPEMLKDKKIVINGMGKITEKLIRNKIIVAAVIEDVVTDGYNSGKKMFDILYKDIKYTNSWEKSSSKIVIFENLEE